VSVEPGAGQLVHSPFRENNGQKDNLRLSCEARAGHFRTVSAEDAVLKKELLDLADVCEEVANNIEDRLTSG
jgi:hypothetical protein